MEWKNPITSKPFFAAMAVLLFLATPFYALEAFYPAFLGVHSIPFLAFALACLLEGILMVVTIFQIDKKPPTQIAIGFARYEFAANPIFTCVILSLSIIFPQAPRDWLYFTNMVITVVLILARLIAVIYLNNKMKKGDTAYLPFRNHAYILTAGSIIAANYYIVSIWKSQNMDLSIITEGGRSLAGFTDFFLVMSLLEVVLGILILLQSLFFAIANYFSGKENKVIDLRLNFRQSRELIRKYEIPFWVGIFSLALLLVISVISMISAPTAYAPIATLYFIVLVIRLTTHFMVSRIKKKTGNEPRATFREEHGALLFAAVLFAIYAVLCALFGRIAFERMVDVKYTLFLTFGLFVPWAVIKLVLGSISFIRSKKRGDPSLMLYAYLDILLSIYTLAQTFAIVAVKAHMEGFRIAAIVLAVLLSVYCLSSSVRMIITGIRGLKGKRTRAFALYESFHRDE